MANGGVAAAQPQRGILRDLRSRTIHPDEVNGALAGVLLRVPCVQRGKGVRAVEILDLAIRLGGARRAVDGHGNVDHAEVGVIDVTGDRAVVDDATVIVSQ